MKAVIFDFFGVICNEIGSQWYSAHVPAEQLPELKEKYDGPSDIGEISDEQFFEGISKAVYSTGETVHREWVDSAVIDQQLLGLVRELKAHGIKTAICSNTPTKLFNELAEGYKDLFDVVVLSSEARLIKPQPAIFNLTLERLGVSAEEALFVDDRQVNVAGAEAVGIKGILYQSPETLRQELEEVLK